MNGPFTLSRQKLYSRYSTGSSSRTASSSGSVRTRRIHHPHSTAASASASLHSAAAAPAGSDQDSPPLTLELADATPTRGGLPVTPTPLIGGAPPPPYTRPCPEILGAGGLRRPPASSGPGRTYPPGAYPCAGG
ncbi:hypothetical protein EW145_g8604 [Phellinidium pouzarii]|uniref:Uncharacterized protein n=1 Tax=Phellinidium pouzarii TaxID=167371 RepID=A0A4S4K4S4_9AGAM|nr:hypothetical protein EW145_g8604 [Phellinidium pouzarii]